MNEGAKIGLRMHMHPEKLDPYGIRDLWHTACLPGTYH